MDVKKLVMGMVGIMICAVMIGGTLLPAIGSVTDENRTVFNSNLNSAPSIEVFENPTGNVTIEYTPGQGKAIINGVEYNTSSYDGNIFWCDKGFIMSSNSSTLTNYYYGYIVDDEGKYDGTADTTKITISIVNNDVTVTREGANITYTWNDCKWVAYASPNATHKIISSGITTPYYISDDNDVIGFAYINTDTLGGIDFKGTVANIHKTGENQNMILNKEKVEGYHDLYEVDNSKEYYLDPAYLTNSDETVISPYFYLVPYEIVAETEQGAVINMLFNTIPIVAVAGLVMAGIYVFISRK